MKGFLTTCIAMACLAMLSQSASAQCGKLGQAFNQHVANSFGGANCGRGITNYEAAGLWANYCNEDCTVYQGGCSSGCNSGCNSGCGNNAAAYGYPAAGNDCGTSFVANDCGSLNQGFGDGCGGGCLGGKLKGLFSKFGNGGGCGSCFGWGDGGCGGGNMGFGFANSGCCGTEIGNGSPAFFGGGCGGGCGLLKGGMGLGLGGGCGNSCGMGGGGLLAKLFTGKGCGCGLFSGGGFHDQRFSNFYRTYGSSSNTAYFSNYVGSESGFADFGTAVGGTITNACGCNGMTSAPMAVQPMATGIDSSPTVGSQGQVEAEGSVESGN